jgi:hypothetical protein
MTRALRRLAVGAVGLALAACAANQAPVAGLALEPRFVAVHNAFAAMGLAQIGPIQEGALREGQETRVQLALPAGCVTVVALGGDGVRDLDATLLDSHGTPLAHDTTMEPQAVLRPCLEGTDAYVLVLRAAAGGGTWTTATWSGGPTGKGTTAATPEANGTCAAPIPLAAGSVTGSTTRGDHENAGSCGTSDSRELAYQLDVTNRERVGIDVEARFDSVLYVRKDDCAEPSAEIDCNDDYASDRTRSRIDRVFEPGKYYVFVDGYGQESGAFKMKVTVTDVAAIADMCAKALPLPIGAAQAATTAGLADDAKATCGGGADGADAVWRAEVPSRSRVRIVEHSDEMTPVVHVRRACADEQSELACGEGGAGSGDAAIVSVMDPGTYAVFADAHDRDAAGHYTLLFETAPLAGSGTPGDACGDAIPIALGPSGSVSGDTFAARDDFGGSCGGAGAPDVVYRIDVARQSRLTASLDGEESPHALVMWRRCGDRSSEVGCGRAIDEVVGPGTYFVAVDGAAPDTFGRFTLNWTLHDLAGQAAACGTAPTLVDGARVSGTTVGAGDKFATSCASADASGADRVYKFVLASRANVHLALTASTFDATLALRRACSDASAGPGSPELVCESEPDSNHRSVIERSLEAGSYWVIVDGQSANDQGPFSLDYKVVR